MNGVTIEHDFDGLAEYLGHASRESMKQADLAMGRGAQEIARDAKQNAPKFLTTLANSILPRKVGELHHEVGTGMQYAAARELGTAPAWPDMSPGSDFRKWVERITGTKGDEADRKAFLLGRRLSRKGTEASEYMRRAYDDNIDRIEARISGAIGKGLET